MQDHQPIYAYVLEHHSIIMLYVQTRTRMTFNIVPNIKY